jgi:hypothetical protein
MDAGGVERQSGVYQRAPSCNSSIVWVGTYAWVGLNSPSTLFWFGFLRPPPPPQKVRFEVGVLVQGLEQV